MESTLRENIVAIVKLYTGLVHENIKEKVEAEEITEAEMAGIRENIKTMHHAVTCLDKTNRIWNRKDEIPAEMNDLKVQIERMAESFSALICKVSREHPEEIRENIKALDDISLVLTAIDHMQRKACGPNESIV